MSPSALLLLALTACSGPPPTGRMDVLLVTIDTVRADEPGFMGGSAPTPHLDELAASSRVYRLGWSATNMTIPSHGVILSGIDAPETSLRSNADAPSPTLPWLPTLFHDAGWATVGSVGMDVLAQQFSRGFDQWTPIPTGERRAGEVATTLLTHLANVPATTPVFAWAHFFDAHAPYAPLPEWSARTYQGDATQPADVAPPWASAPLAPIMRNRPELRQVHDPSWPRAMRAAELGAVDDAIGRVLDAFAARGNRLTVMVVGDHGESLGESRVWFDHAGPNAVNFHIPYLLHADSVDAGRVEGLATHLDVAPTLLTLAGVPLPPALSGCNLAGPGGPTACDRQELVLDDRHPPQTGGLVVMQDWFFARWGPSEHGPARDELTHLEGRAWVYADDTEKRATFDTLLRDRQTRWTQAPSAAAGATDEQLKRLGYLEP